MQTLHGKVAVVTGGSIDILVNNVWGGYERMVDNGAFTWPKPFWEQPLWRWDAMFSAGVRAHYHASQLAAPGTGKVLVAAALANEYGFTDLDGTTPRPLTLADV